MYSFRELWRDYHLERLALWWAFWLAVAAAGAAAYFTWHRSGDQIVTIVASILAFCVGGLLGYKLALPLTILLGLAFLVAGVLFFIRYQSQEEAKKNAVFDPNSLSTTLLWMEGQGQKVTGVDEQKNEVLSKEALEELKRNMASVEGTQVRWQATAASVSSDGVRLQAPSMGSGYFLTFGVVAARKSPSEGQQPHGLVLPIAPEQSRTFVAGQTITFTGRVRTCRANSNRAFTLVVSEATVVD